MSIRIKPEELWDYFIKNKKRLSEVFDIIGESDVEELGVKLLLTNENGLPYLVIRVDGDDVYEMEVSDEEESQSTAIEVFDRFEEIEDETMLAVSEEIDDTDQIYLMAQDLMSALLEEYDIDTFTEDEIEMVVAAVVGVLQSFGYEI